MPNLIPPNPDLPPRHPFLSDADAEAVADEWCEACSGRGYEAGRAGGTGRKDCAVCADKGRTAERRG